MKLIAFLFLRASACPLLAVVIAACALEPAFGVDQNGGPDLSSSFSDPPMPANVDNEFTILDAISVVCIE